LAIGLSGLENDDKVTAISTLTNKVIATVPISQAPQALVYVLLCFYVPNTVPMAPEPMASLA
jgi:YVTN family beta-propeller protein